MKITILNHCIYKKTNIDEPIWYAAQSKQLCEFDLFRQQHESLEKIQNNVYIKDTELWVVLISGVGFVFQVDKPVIKVTKHKQHFSSRLHAHCLSS